MFCEFVTHESCVPGISSRAGRPFVRTSSAGVSETKTFGTDLDRLARHVLRHPVPRAALRQLLEALRERLRRRPRAVLQVRRLDPSVAVEEVVDPVGRIADEVPARVHPELERRVGDLHEARLAEEREEDRVGVGVEDRRRLEVDRDALLVLLGSAHVREHAVEGDHGALAHGLDRPDGRLARGRVLRRRLRKAHAFDLGLVRRDEPGLVVRHGARLEVHDAVLGGGASGRPHRDGHAHRELRVALPGVDLRLLDEDLGAARGVEARPPEIARRRRRSSRRSASRRLVEEERRRRSPAPRGISLKVKRGREEEFAPARPARRIRARTRHRRPSTRNARSRLLLIFIEISPIPEF